MSDSSITFPEDTLQVEIVERMPKFEGGDNEQFAKYIATETFYSPLMRKYQTAEKIYMQFVIDIDGTICDISVMRGSTKDFIAEAKRILYNCPKWSPGYQKGKAVKVKFTVPINFTLR